MRPGRRLTLHVLLVLALAVGACSPPARWSGQAAPSVPSQAAAQPGTTFKVGDYTLTALASFSGRAVVLSRHRYTLDRESALAPVDLALGWGPMSTAAALNGLSISQSGRWYEYRWSSQPPIPPGDIAANSANMHFIPASRTVKDQLLRVRRHEVVEFDGFLVHVVAPDGWQWRSSLTRADTGGGACEVVYATRIRRVRARTSSPD